MNVLVVGNYSLEHREAIDAAIARAGQSCVFLVDTAQAKQRLLTPGAPPPRCVFVDGATPGVDVFVRMLRGQARLFSVPVFATVANVADQLFATAHSYGVDDVISDRDMGAFTRRAAVLSDFDSNARPETSQGVAVIAHADPQARQLYGRILRQAGFDSAFAGDGDELLTIVAREKAPRIVVIAHDLAPNLVQLIADARERAKTPLLAHAIVGHGAEMRALEAQIDGQEGIDALSSLAPPDNLLFVVNEMLRREYLRGKGSDQRASTRLLFGTLSAFRTAGEIRSVYGFSYNLSREGLYVKTYDPPARDTELWLELRPPMELVGVHLRGRVMWSRKPDPSAAAAAPPGFGLRIEATACPPGDLARYEAAYEQLLARPRISYRVAA